MYCCFASCLRSMVWWCVGSCFGVFLLWYDTFCCLGSLWLWLSVFDFFNLWVFGLCVPRFKFRKRFVLATFCIVPTNASQNFGLFFGGAVCGPPGTIIQVVVSTKVGHQEFGKFGRPKHGFKIGPVMSYSMAGPFSNLSGRTSKPTALLQCEGQ